MQTQQYQGQMVRATGKLMSVHEDRVQLQLAGEGAPLFLPLADSPCTRSSRAPFL